MKREHQAMLRCWKHMLTGQDNTEGLNLIYSSVVSSGATILYCEWYSESSRNLSVAYRQIYLGIFWKDAFGRLQRMEYIIFDATRQLSRIPKEFCGSSRKIGSSKTTKILSIPFFILLATCSVIWIAAPGTSSLATGFHFLFFPTLFNSTGDQSVQLSNKRKILRSGALLYKTFQKTSKTFKNLFLWTCQEPKKHWTQNIGVSKTVSIKNWWTQLYFLNV